MGDRRWSGQRGKEHRQRRRRDVLFVRCRMRWGRPRSGSLQLAGGAQRPSSGASARPHRARGPGTAWTWPRKHVVPVSRIGHSIGSQAPWNQHLTSKRGAQHMHSTGRPCRAGRYAEAVPNRCQCRTRSQRCPKIQWMTSGGKCSSDGRHTGTASSRFLSPFRRSRSRPRCRAGASASRSTADPPAVDMCTATANMSIIWSAILRRGDTCVKTAGMNRSPG